MARVCCRMLVGVRVWERRQEAWDVLWGLLAAVCKAGWQRLLCVHWEGCEAVCKGHIRGLQAAVMQAGR